MKQFLSQSQKIKAVCIVKCDNKILLLRSDQVVNPEHQPRGGYFDVPSFTVSFGEDPETTLRNAFEDYFGQSVDNLSMLDVRQYMADNDTTQIFEVVYTAKSLEDIQTSGRHGRFLFVEVHELGAYMFPQEREFLEKYL